MLPTVLALVAFAVLASAGGLHLVRLRSFSQAIRSHGLWPEAGATLFAFMAMSLELAIGLLGVTSLVAGSEKALDGASGSAAALLGVYGIYAAVILHRSGPVPCGCSSGDEPVSVFTVVRAGALAAMALAGLAAEASHLSRASEPEFLMSVLSAVGLAAILWMLPAALSQPYGPGGPQTASSDVA